jgi:hypothetical protein
MSASSRLLIASLLLSAWLGGALLTVAVVAPGAFAVLPTRTMAGEMVGRVLGVVFVSGLVVGIAVAMAAGAGRTSPGAAITALLASAACAVAQFGINPRIAQIRSDIGGPVDLLPLDDARRVAFGLLHGYSVAGLGVAMLSAAVSLGFLLVALRPRS